MNELDGLPSKQVRMYLGGSGGTGKSRVILAVKCFHKLLNIENSLCITAYTGTAASAIKGSTISSMAQLRHSNQSNSRALEDKWSNVNTLIVDEVSMIGCRMMKRLNEKLNTAKHVDSSLTFGGIPTVIFSGKLTNLKNNKDE